MNSTFSSAEKSLEGGEIDICTHIIRYWNVQGGSFSKVACCRYSHHYKPYFTSHIYQRAFKKPNLKKHVQAVLDQILGAQAISHPNYNSCKDSGQP